MQFPSGSSPEARLIFYGIFIGISVATLVSSANSYVRKRRRLNPKKDSDQWDQTIDLKGSQIVNGVAGLVGNTPLVRIPSLSDALGVEIIGKAEFLNPGGSVKDRVALRMIEDAELNGLLIPHTGSRIFEGTVGSTGISLATIARARGYNATIIIPDDVAEEKAKALAALGADLERVRPASIVDKKQYVNVAKRYAQNFGQTELSHELPIRSSAPENLQGPSAIVRTFASERDVEHADDSVAKEPRGFFADQFENRSNFDAHFEGTGPEIWRQTNGNLNAFVAGAGTGGTVAGVGHYLKSNNRAIIIGISDPNGSGLFNKIRHGILYDPKESEGTKRRHQVDTVVEGIGINRLTKNIEAALNVIDQAYRVTDAEAVSMSRYLVKHDGLFLGSSSACNLVACVKLVKNMQWKNGQTVVTILCDSGNRHYSKFWNDEYLQKAGIQTDLSLTEDLLRS